MERGSDYVRADSLDVAVKILAEGPRTILAGGTDVFPGLQGRPLTGPVLDISGIATLGQVSFDGGYWYIGATASWQNLIITDLPAAFDALKAAAREVGSVQIQNRATVIGNLCNASPAADGVPPLLTLDAEVEIVSIDGTRYMELSDFIVGNRKTALRAGEMVGALRIPSSSARGTSSFFKIGARSYLVISISMVALRIDVDKVGMISEIAIAVGACSEVAIRMKRVEEFLLGTPIVTASDRLTSELFDCLDPIDDVRATADYRREASVEVVRRLLNNQKTVWGSG